MASVTLASPYINPNLQKRSFSCETHSAIPRDDSFASYLNLIRENFPPDLGNSAVNQNPSRSYSFQVSLGRKRADDGELDIFGAEKYFSSGMDVVDLEPTSEKGGKSSFKRESKSSGKSRSSASTCSETSGNSQSTLLRNRRRPPTPPSIAGQRQANGKRFLGVFRCSCSRKDVVEVESDAGEYETQSRNSNKGATFGEFRPDGEMGIRRSDGLGFHFPNSDPAAAKLNIGMEKADIGSSRRRSLTILTSLEGCGKGIGRADDDDLGSETSSDLFEIESLTINSQPFSNGVESLACYEPSEVSIAWSVATASAANVSTAESDWNAEHQSARESEGKKQGSSSGRKSRPGLLLGGCVSDKAVRVTAEKGSTRSGFGLESSTATAGRYRELGVAAARASFTRAS